VNISVGRTHYFGLGWLIRSILVGLINLKLLTTRLFVEMKKSVCRINLPGSVILIFTANSSSPDFRLFVFLDFVKVLHGEVFAVFLNKLKFSQHSSLFATSAFTFIDSELHVFKIKSLYMLYMIGLYWRL
jgi:hypothetical protein